MVASIGDAGQGRGYSQTWIGGQDIEHAWSRDGDRRRGLCQNGRGCGRLSSVRNIRQNPFELVACATHESVTETTEIGAVAYFLGEDVRNVAFAADVGDGDSAIVERYSHEGYLLRQS